MVHREFSREKDYYPVLKRKFIELIKAKGCEVHLEITADKGFTNKIKSKIPYDRHIIFYFLRDVRPDITGFIEKDSFSDFVIIEIKNEVIKLDHIYKIRMYDDLFDAKFAFLVSTKEIPEEIKGLSRVIYPLLSTSSIYRSRTLVYFDGETQSFKDWYPENPFEKDLYWR